MKRSRRAIVLELLLWLGVAAGTAIALILLSEKILPTNF